MDIIEKGRGSISNPPALPGIPEMPAGYGHLAHIITASNKNGTENGIGDSGEFIYDREESSLDFSS